MPARPRRIVVSAYDPAWSERFRLLRIAISHALGNLAVAVHHVGSTSVIGLAAKPILDVDVEFASIDDVSDVIRRLAAVGYEHQGDLGIAGREAFRRSAEDIPRDGAGRVWPAHHLYACASGSVELSRHLAFRDYLLTHPATVAQYGRLKLDLARKFEFDIDSYTAGKSEFVAEVLLRAGR